MAKSLAQLKTDARRAGWSKYIQSENDERALLDGCRVDERFGLRVVEFCRRFLRHSKGIMAGKMFEPAPFQRDDIIMPLFSWVHDDGRRRFKTADIWVPKKSTKSFLSSAFCMYMLIGDGEDGAEIYCAACDRAQAAIVFNEAANMVEASPELRLRVEVVRSSKTIRFGTKAWIRALSAEHASAQGLNPSYVSIDEIHAFNSRGGMLREALRYGGRARRQPLEATLSTAGDANSEIGRRQYDFAKSVQIGATKTTTAFVYIKEASPTDDWTDEEVWKKANPGLGITFTMDQMREDFNNAKQDPGQQSSFKRYLLNMWVGASEPWLNYQDWKACENDVLNLDDYEGRICCGGLDLSSTTDLSAFVLVFREDDGDYTLFPWFWLPEENLHKRESEDRMEYRRFTDAGYLELTPGNRIDYAYILKRILEIKAHCKLKQIGFDPYNADWLVEQMQGQRGIEMVEMRQGFMSMSQPSKDFDRLVAMHKTRHPGNPILDWMVSKVCIATDPAGNIKPVKSDQAKRRQRIDGVVASIMGCNLAQRFKKRAAYSSGKELFVLA